MCGKCGNDYSNVLLHGVSRILVEHISINGKKCQKTLVGTRTIHEKEDKCLMRGTCTIEFPLIYTVLFNVSVISRILYELTCTSLECSNVGQIN